MPVLIDITAPQNPYAVINHRAFMTNSPDVAVTISATDLRSALAELWRRFLQETPMTYLTRWRLLRVRGILQPRVQTRIQPFTSQIPSRIKISWPPRTGALATKFDRVTPPPQTIVRY